MTCPRLTDRQLLALLAVEKECPDESKGISPDQLAVSMELKGADTSRVARSILNQLNKKDLVQKSLLSEGMGRGIVSYYSLSPFAKKILSQHHLEPMILIKQTKPAKSTLMSPYENHYGVVYFIGNEDSGPVKIGFTSNEEPSGRLQALQTASPVKLQILGYINGSIKVENKIHSFLRLHRLRGEWFERDAALSILNHLTPKSIFTQLSEEDVFTQEILNTANNIDYEEDETMKSLALTVTQHLLWELTARFGSCRTRDPIPLLSWLLQQVEREDATGDLARDAKDDSNFPPVGVLTDYFYYLYSRLSPEMTRTVIESWIECQQVVCQLDRLT
jgi:hypothetical protein